MKGNLCLNNMNLLTTRDRVSVLDIKSIIADRSSLDLDVMGRKIVVCYQQPIGNIVRE